MCRCGIPAFPELPQRPMTSPRRTRAPAVTLDGVGREVPELGVLAGRVLDDHVIAGVAALLVGGPVARVAVGADDGAVGGREHRPSVAGERGQRRARLGAGVSSAARARSRARKAAYPVGRRCRTLWMTPQIPSNGSDRRVTCRRRRRGDDRVVRCRSRSVRRCGVRGRCAGPAQRSAPRTCRRAARRRGRRPGREPPRGAAASAAGARALAGTGRAAACATRARWAASLPGLVVSRGRRAPSPSVGEGGAQLSSDAAEGRVGARAILVVGAPGASAARRRASGGVARVEIAAPARPPAHPRAHSRIDRIERVGRRRQQRAGQLAVGLEERVDGAARRRGSGRARAVLVDLDRGHARARARRSVPRSRRSNGRRIAGVWTRTRRWGRRPGPST